jgi:hypothetical protein
MSCIEVEQGVETWLPFLANDSDTGDPRTGVTYDQIDVSYKKYGDTVFTSKTLVGPGTDFRENGSGIYEISFSTTELDTEGTFLYVINSNGALPPPALKQYVGQAFIVDSASYTPGQITLNTNILTGNLIDLTGNPISNASVSAQVLSAPTVMGTSPNIGGVTTSVISAETDSSGFFALEVIQEAVVTITIPRVNYYRTLTVPTNTTDNLFTLP